MKVRGREEGGWKVKWREVVGVWWIRVEGKREREGEREEEEGRRRRETTPLDPSLTSWVGKKGVREIIVWITESKTVD